MAKAGNLPGGRICAIKNGTWPGTRRRSEGVRRGPAQIAAVGPANPQTAQSTQGWLYGTLRSLLAEVGLAEARNRRAVLGWLPRLAALSSNCMMKAVFIREGQD